jgi:hypothetical protein
MPMNGNCGKIRITIEKCDMTFAEIGDAVTTLKAAGWSIENISVNTI